MARIKGIKIDGFKETYKNLGLLEEEIEKAAMKGVRKLANNILAESQKIAPRDTGTLRHSGVVTNGGAPTNFDEIYRLAKAKAEAEKTGVAITDKELLSIRAKGEKIPLTVTISYNTPYARKQHEDNTLNHPKEGQAKYLERVFNEKSRIAENLVGDSIHKVLQRKAMS